ncbi:hypothetical protein S40293_05158 [Stachybotrys chartarum IBT 40293]|nr:hypothetical protein S40293_05158 [Stachybotrys chartarum IBT 40293]
MKDTPAPDGPPPSHPPSFKRPNIQQPPQAQHLPIMNKDACFTFVHMHRASDADLFEDFCKDRLPVDDIYVAPQHQPINPEDEDDVVPDQHAAFGIQRATQEARDPAWKDLGLAALMGKGPGKGRALNKSQRLPR